MRYKQEYYKLNEMTTPKTLVWPIMYRKVTPVPAAVQNISYLDYSSYNLVGDAFFKSEKFIEFQKQLQNQIQTIVDIITHAPDYDLYWDTQQGREEILQALKDYFINNDDFDKPFQKPIVWPQK